MSQFSQHTGYFERIGNAIKGMVFGGVLFVLSFVLLFWNEGHAVHRAKVLSAGASAVVDVAGDKVDPGCNGKLVHFVADTKGQPLTDDDYGVSIDGIALQRTVKMYQWKETVTEKKDAVGGGSTRTPSYSKVWSESEINSSKYMDPSRANPLMPVASYIHRAAPVTAGAFTLSSALVNQVNNFTAITPGKIPPAFANRAAILDSTVYIAHQGATSRPTGAKDEAQIGDVMITFAVAKPGTVSVVACQNGANLGPFATPSGPLGELLKVGSVSGQVMIQQEQQANVILTWVLRGVGLLVMWIGLLMIFSPLKVLADVIGIFGDIVGAGLGLITGLAAVSLSLITIAVAWLVFRPVLGVGLLLLAALAIYGIHHMRTSAKARRVQTSPPLAAP